MVSFTEGGTLTTERSVLPVAVSAEKAAVRKSRKEGDNCPTVDAFGFSHQSVSLDEESLPSAEPQVCQDLELSGLTTNGTSLVTYFGH